MVAGTQSGSRDMTTTDTRPHTEHGMFIKVRYGDNLHKIFNPNCRNNVLLHNIKERCDCDDLETVELSDEAGMVKNLHKNPTDYGIDYFTDRETLVLLRVDKEIDGEDERPIFVPLVEGMDEDKEFIERRISARFGSSTSDTSSSGSSDSQAKLNPRPSNNDKRSSSEGRTSKAGKRGSQKQRQSKKEKRGRNGGSTTPKTK